MSFEQTRIETAASPGQADLPYAMLRSALELFERAPAELSDEERIQAERQAARVLELESRILSAREAIGVVAGEDEVTRAIQEVRARYEDDDRFLAALAENGLTEETLRLALARQCRVNTVLDKVVAGDDEISEVDIGLFYHEHKTRFVQPEKREVLHILITVNEQFPENSREQALVRIKQIAQRLAQKPRMFEELATRHSECPTAMDGGKIGAVVRGQLYPELDKALFEMKPDQISGIVESEMGFHLLWCKSITTAKTVSLKKATPQIRLILQDRTRESRRRNWIRSLQKPTQPGARS
ncbi:nitrogen fixation protein NifM [Candidatus Methylospira mobilis]|uniref:peptidylprolyl isomerase n=1 Tax=Candidatus Methylospira mobilis TaxID=1808979 RepID=A0A5Q0BE88_9GAMM|nr:nitrogen fixation protein NifM [Candidatus Methylospira mobilis]QFY41839.1 nitrogen fixation protein NifM [Candidatus Methylospira mobilis]